MAQSGVVEAAWASCPTLQRGAMAGARGTTGPAIVKRETLMILTDINPARRMGCEGRASKVTAVAADGIATAVKIEAMAALAAA